MQTGSGAVQTAPTSNADRTGTRKVQTAEEKAQATAKRLATRKQRGLVSKKAQKAAATAETPATTAQPAAPAPATPKS